MEFKMVEFTESIGFIVSFLVGVLFFYLLFGEKVTTIFLGLVLGGMVLTNTDKIKSLIGRKQIEEEQKRTMSKVY